MSRVLIAQPIDVVSLRYKSPTYRIFLDVISFEEFGTLTSNSFANRLETG